MPVFFAKVLHLLTVDFREAVSVTTSQTDDQKQNKFVSKIKSVLCCQTQH